VVRVSYLIGIVLAVTFSASAWAATNCNSQQQQVNIAQRNLATAENTRTRELENLYRTQDQVEDRTLIMQAQVDQYRSDAELVRSYPASYYGTCWGWNVWGLAQCGIWRNNRRNISIRNADARVQQSQARLQNYIRYGQRLVERQAQRVVQAQQLVAFRTQQLDQANSALAQCQAGLR
jgi:hypothetical protein